MSFAYLASTPGLKHNYSLYAIPAGWVVSMVPLWWAIGKAESTTKGTYSNALPKEAWSSSNLKEKLPEDTYKKVIKAVAANNNSHVNLPLFASALIIGNVVHLPSRTLHNCAVAYLTLRSAYNLAYIFIEDEAWSALRSALYLGGVGTCLTLFIKSANKLAALPW